MKNLEDILYPLLDSYKRSPQFIKNILGGIYSSLPKNVKYGPNYKKFLKLIKKAREYSRDEILSYQWKEIEKVLDIAFSSIPFYKKLYSDYGIDRNQIQNFNDFEKLPIIDKHLIRENVELMVSPGYQSRKLKMNTGGSTGTPMEFFIHKGITRPKERAFLDSFFESVGYTTKKRAVTFRGDRVSGQGIYTYDPIKNNYVFSSYRISKKNINLIVSEINKIKPDFMFGYPSVVYDVARLIKQNSLSIFDVKLDGIILASEKLFPFQVQLIEEVFQSKVFCYYGHSERLVLAYKCEQCKNYKLDPIYGYAEIIDDKDLNITTPGEKGRIIATGFHNYVMPLIRYDTNDISSFADDHCEKCSNSNSTLFADIDGRTSDFIIGSDGRKISITAIIFGQHLSEFSKIQKFQMIQNETGLLEFNIAGENKLSNFEMDNLEKKIEQASDNTVSVNVQYVDKLIKSKSGKFRYLIQNIKG